MTMNHSEMLPTLREKIARICKADAHPLKNLSQCITSIQETLAGIKQYLDAHTFPSEAESIHFYKNVKPEFDALLLYYFRLFRITQTMPLAGKEAIRHHYTEELKKIHAYYDANQEFVRYHRLDATHLDRFYFIPQPGSAWATHQEDVLLYALEHNAPMSSTLASIMAYDQLQVELTSRISDLDKQPESILKDRAKPGLRWTSSKANLIELMYALKAARVFNDGIDIDISQIAGWLQSTLHIDLGNYYRVAQAIRIRKKVRTQFCNVLGESLTQFMDHTDSNPRY